MLDLLLTVVFYLFFARALGRSFGEILSGLTEDLITGIRSLSFSVLKGAIVALAVVLAVKLLLDTYPNMFFPTDATVYVPIRALARLLDNIVGGLVDAIQWGPGQELPSLPR